MLDNKLQLDIQYCDSICVKIINKIHKEGPINESDLETLALIKHWHPELFHKYEHTLLNIMGLFYKVNETRSLLDVVYSAYAQCIKLETGHTFTPMQADAYQNIKEFDNFSFSAPTSTGKSYMFRTLIQETTGDVIIIVPSRALLTEYLLKLYTLVDKQTLVLPFIDIVNTKHCQRHIFVLTPERGSELFKHIDKTNVQLFLFDEAQLSEEPGIRGMKFDSFVRRVSRYYPRVPKVFAHPFVANPVAQLNKHNLQNAKAIPYEQRNVGKIFLTYRNNHFSYFSPYKDDTHPTITMSDDIVLSIIRKSKSCVLFYVSKEKIYNHKIFQNFGKYIDECPLVTDENALSLIRQLEAFFGVKNEEKSTIISLMKQGIVLHHGSMPLIARSIIEKFVLAGYAKMCFSTSTLLQGINLPFDLVWIDNIRAQGSDMYRSLSLKNLIGRAGRVSNKIDNFDYGYVVIDSSHKPTFISRLIKNVVLQNTSILDNESPKFDQDYQDEAEAVINDTFCVEYNITKVQENRLRQGIADNDIRFLLDNLFFNGNLITAKQYYQIQDASRNQIKTSFKNVFVSQLSRQVLTAYEATVLSIAIPILLWKIQGKSFAEIVSLRYAFLSNRDEQRRLKKQYDNGEINGEMYKKTLENLQTRYLTPATHLPNRTYRYKGKKIPVTQLDYDSVIYDTYDYLDKVISLSLKDAFVAAMKIYYDKYQDKRALVMANYISYATNDETEIMLLRYGFSFEDIEWVKPCVKSISEEEIVFDYAKLQGSLINDIRHLVVDRYLYD